ncbi:hypothetical protein L249_2734 [Ophiocordyceps polyrhachis-furcata BCC 54312]|uniref:ceramidase n=1 Tax=Ophiocordyceps polyrhachis-furcata BCC 54312 TaxID=1330021 RepID=A0A367LNJ2_9HYPO|nr:hypothetical protein L249_2734 [Ophiocordyceps polyrhachis-furcata BCC 54312]
MSKVLQSLSLNDAQKRAVTSNASTVAILAGPGSGKTHTLTARVVWLVQQAGYKPCDIIIATFTVKAAKEMKTRISKALGEELSSRIILGTFHSISRRYLAKYGRLIGLDSKFGIADAGDSKAIIERICKRLGLMVDASHARSWISKRKSTGASPAPPQPTKQNREMPALLTCFEEYQAHLSRANLLDYDDLLVRCAELLLHHPSCVSNIQAVLVDEYQDTNGVQYDLMKLFAQQRRRITIVGDPDQSIYGWRSADVRNLRRLLQEFRETEEVALEENYRSSQLILFLSLNVIQQDKKRYQKMLVSVHPKGLKPVLRKLKTSVAEAEWIVSEIRRITMLTGKMLEHQDVAILLRSASLSRHVESALGKAHIPYRMVGGTKFFDRREIKVLLDYLRVIHKPDCNDALSRIINIPRRGIGENTIKYLLEEAEQAKMSLWSLLWRHCRGERRAKTNLRAKMEQSLATGLRIMHNLRVKAAQIDGANTFTLLDIVESLVDQLAFKKYLEGEYAEDHEGRWANVQELVSMAGDTARSFFEAADDEALPEVEGVEQARDDDVLGRFLANVALASDAGKDDGRGDQASLVTISTIHAAKGLEWPVVFIPSVYAGSIPHARSDDSDEERRLLYVAMTRAQASLYLSWPLYGPQSSGGKTELSPFVSSFAGMFAPKGPSLDKCVVREMAQVLGREAPEDKDIYDKLPVGFMPEDDGFPIEPIDRDNPDGFDDFKGRKSRAAKRLRTDCSNQKEEQPWKADYMTTMGAASQFTMPPLPGFVSAGAHHSAAKAAPVPPLERGKPAGARGRGTGRLGPDQRSLLGYVTKTSSTDADRSTDRAAQYSGRTTSTTVDGSKAVLDPALTRHKVSAKDLLARPARRQDDDSRRHYAQFSSSPPSLEDQQQQQQQQTSTCGSKPATSFHATTFTSVTQQTGGGGGVRRQTGLGPRPTLDRRKKRAVFPHGILRLSRPFLMATMMKMPLLPLLPLAIFAFLLQPVVGAYNRGSKYLIGVGKADITGPVVELGLSGYANLKQVGSGLRQRLYSRAFIIGSASDPSERFVYVVIETQSGDTAVRNGVLERLASLGDDYKVYGHGNVALTGTHSHAGPGGWSNYLLPQIPNLGFDKQSYEAIVSGTVLSIQRAHEHMQEGHLDISDTRLPDGAINRSPYAWLANPQAERDLYPDETDKTLTLLRFRRASDLKMVGVLTWFAVHGTSLLGNNTLVAGDNKGVAAWLLEDHFRRKASSLGSVEDFVAGFSQSSVGDTTPNVLGAYCDDGSGQRCSFEKSTCADGKSQSCHGRGPEFRELDLGVMSCLDMGRRQANASKAILFTTLNGSKAMTCPAALGYSFAAGTSDWPGAFDFTQGDSGKPSANPLWRLVSGFLKTPSKRQEACQGAKPILLDVGEMEEPFAWSPNIVDIQMFRVGQLFFIISPSEATTMSGRRWKAAVADFAGKSLGVRHPLVVLGGPANTYAHYCATAEEYRVQRYEGASTLYGPHQLEAFINLTVSNMHYLDGKSTGSPSPGPAPPDNRNKSISLITPVFYDGHPIGSWYGKVLREPEASYEAGAAVMVNATFQAANPRNNLRLEGTYLSVEKKLSSSSADGRGAEDGWQRYRADDDWFLAFHWRRTNTVLGWSEVDAVWDMRGGDAEPGVYRFRYYGDAKSFIGAGESFEGTSRSFTLK